MNGAYLNMVRVYLQQELPETYREHIQVSKEKLIIAIPDRVNFNQVYATLQETITDCINRIRNRDIDLEFTIRSVTQERDFKILK